MHNEMKRIVSSCASTGATTGKAGTVSGEQTVSVSYLTLFNNNIQLCMVLSIC